MIQYFQLTPEILLEYIYEGDPKLKDKDNGDSEDQNSDKGYTKDIYDDYPTMLLKSNAFGTKYLFFKNESEGLDSISNLVLPLNNSETQFVVAQSVSESVSGQEIKNHFFSKTNVSNLYGGGGYIYEDTNYDLSLNKSCDVKYDKCIVHFTSRNYFENYNALIFQAYVYMKNKAKLYFSSFLFRKTSNLELKSEHLLYNEKLYTTHIEFDIPSVFAIFTDNKENLVFNNLLKSQNIDLLKNTPIGINVYGVSTITKGTSNFEILKSLKLNSIHIPYIYNRLDDINVDIRESEIGDYYEINPNMSSNYTSFVDYIESMGEDIRAYIVMHELSLRETWVDNDNTKHTEVTHREQHIINIYEDDEDNEISKKFDAKIKYRPICMHSGLGYKALIIDTIKIINTVDSSSYEVTGSIDISNPHKYGKKLKRLGVSESRPIVNVYNKKLSDEKALRNSISLNRSGGFVVENMSQNITSFIESTNIGVSVVELSPEDIN